MRTAKIITIITGIVLLIGITVVGILGITGVIPITEKAAVGVIITPAIGIILAIFNAKHLFDDPEATTKLKDDHADAIRALKEGHADVIAERDKADAKAQARSTEIALKVHADYRETIAQKDAVIAALNLKLTEEHQRLTEAWKKIPPANARPMGSMMAPGSAHTSTPIPPPK
jgi:hypothetical protein